MIEKKSLNNVDKFGGERIKYRGGKDTWLAMMGTIKVGGTDWGEGKHSKFYSDDRAGNQIEID